MTRFFHALTVIAVNAVPVAGWFLQGWSAGTTLVVYWFENVAACLSVAILIAAHQRLSPRRGHFRYLAPSTNGRGGGPPSSFLNGFLMTSLVFCAAHAIFLGVILLMLARNGERGLAEVHWHSVVVGCALVLVFLIVDLGMDLPRVRGWSFLRIEQAANRGLGRVVVVQLTLIFGLFGVAITGAPAALFGVFIVLKTLYALSVVLPQWEPKTPPTWLGRAMNRLPNVHPGETFEEFWAEDRDDEAARRARNEEPVERL